jgi:ferrous iron transport protein B
VVIIADGMGGGIQVVATFIPIIAALYLFLTLLEEVGYMARAAFVMDKLSKYNVLTADWKKCSCK